MKHSKLVSSIMKLKMLILLMLNKSFQIRHLLPNECVCTYNTYNIYIYIHTQNIYKHRIYVYTYNTYICIYILNKILLLNIMKRIYIFSSIHFELNNLYVNRKIKVTESYNDPSSSFLSHSFILL